MKNSSRSCFQESNGAKKFGNVVDFAKALAAPCEYVGLECMTSNYTQKVPEALATIT